MVTRPAHQAARLCELIRAAGGEELPFPVLEIAPIEDAAPARALFARFEEFDLAVFVSSNAVDYAAELMGTRNLPSTLKLAAVGQRTAECARAHFHRIDIEAPPPYNSEALLTMPALHEMQGKRVMIVRGAGGRELLAETLRARGAEVCYAEVYRRLEPDGDLDMLRMAHPRIDLIIVTSDNGLRNLVSMAGEHHRAWLLVTQLVVISPRTAELATELGFVHPAVVAHTATDEALLAASIDWRSTTRTCFVNKETT